MNNNNETIKPEVEQLNDIPVPNQNNNAPLSNVTNQVVDEIKEKSMVVKEEFEKNFNGFFKYVTTRDTVDLFKLVIRLLLIIGIIAVFYFPISLIKDMGISLLNLIGIKITDVVLNVWYFICDFGYGIAGLVAFYKLVSTRYENILEKKIVPDAKPEVKPNNNINNNNNNNPINKNFGPL